MLSVQEWDMNQKLAIARLAGEALTVVEPIVLPSWGRAWWSRMLAYMNLSQSDCVARPLDHDTAVAILSDKKDIRIAILIDLLAVSMNLDKTSDDPIKSSSDNLTITYDARARRFLFEMTRQLGLQPYDMTAVERSISQQMYFAIQQNSLDGQSSHEGRTAKMDASARHTIQTTNSKKKAMRWLATGAGVLGGGAIIALTGGLAAPLLAPLIAGLTGATFFATAGGVALVTSLFGLTGGGLTGWKMHRRMKGLHEFEFKQILNDADLPPIPALQCKICISGFLLESKDETQTPWEDAFHESKTVNDIYCLKYEKDALFDLGTAFKRFITTYAIRYAGLEVAKKTALHAFFGNIVTLDHALTIYLIPSQTAAVSLPATLLKVSDVIDNPWQIVADRSAKAGIELHRRGCHGIVDHVVLMGAPISVEDLSEWQHAISVTSGRFVNCYTSKDWVLALVYRMHSLATSVAGLSPVPLDRVENIELELEGHTSYPTAVKDIIARINLQ
ncbi:uncharacterized protein BYT42DRAFT_609968 [Radiomyces spectabilis]|uniref:uncharacterized protein n=1 Tax=Radiomyces spectabilis TaxID=64574 RepID=UPI0022211445|nr:uncharacterized protein BYT42DRAFT_609968 [Radiomyces spectabilis]KAI8394237.1 hypothetical protein BYT42DRAFT_609968 [Radiomyces spectabilis]